jgi:Zn-dependent peptidase ImmA (M78 family)/transcriptional regulator with XRE-family HTH domain
MSDSIADRVRQALIDSGMKQTDLAKRLDLEPDKVSKSLKGKRQFSSSEIAEIAKATHRAVEWLLSGEEVVRPRMAHRTTPVLDAEIDEEWKQWAETFAAADASLSRLGYPHELTELPTFVETSMFVKHGERLAEWALGRLHANQISPWQDNLIENIEKTFSVDVAIVDLPISRHGHTLQTNSFRLICLARTTNWARQRFTLAHELCHILSQDAHGEDFDETDSSRRDHDFTEKSANAFAAAFLMPAESVQRFWQEAEGDDLSSKFDEVAWHFKVSPAALGTRLKRLGLIDDAQRTALVGMTMLEVAVFLEREDEFDRYARTSSEHRPPRRLTQWYRAAHSEGKVSSVAAAKLYGITAEEYLTLSDQKPGDDEVALNSNDESNVA